MRALHTPGHVSNHYCFLLEEEGLLFAGDHIMNGSTVVIIPPGGSWTDQYPALAVQMLSAAEGAYTAGWSLANNDPDESPFDFVVDGIVDCAELCLVDFGGARVGVRAPLRVRRVARLLEAHVDELRPGAADTIE